MPEINCWSKLRGFFFNISYWVVRGECPGGLYRIHIHQTLFGFRISHLYSEWKLAGPPPPPSPATMNLRVMTIVTSFCIYSWNHKGHIYIHASISQSWLRKNHFHQPTRYTHCCLFLTLATINSQYELLKSRFFDHKAMGRILYNWIVWARLIDSHLSFASNIWQLSFAMRNSSIISGTSTFYTRNKLRSL